MSFLRSLLLVLLDGLPTPLVGERRIGEGCLEGRARGPRIGLFEGRWRSGCLAGGGTGKRKDGGRGVMEVSAT